MISCTEFIPAYSELFKYLESKDSKEAVVEFWKYLSEKCSSNLKHLVEEKGIRGCWEYWNHTLNEEAADFTMELDEEASEFKITMHHCPSMGRLLEIKHIDPYMDYCKHCDIIYRRILEPLGYEYDIDLSQCHKATCCVYVKKNQKLN